MSILDRAASLLGFERRARSSIKSDAFLSEFFGMRGVGAGVAPDVALSNLAVAARCVSLRSELLASVGLHLYRRTADGGRERADDLPLYGVLHDLANDNQSAFEAREFLVRSVDLYGNGYARVERDSSGQVVALWPLLPGEITVERLSSGRLRYRHTPATGGSYVLLADEVLHVRGPSRDGIVGLSPLRIAAGAVGLAMEQSTTAQSLAHNGLRPAGMLSTDSRLDVAQINTLREQIDQKYAGTTNAGRVLVMSGGLKYSTMSWSPEDAEFLDSRRLSNLDVARIFGIPPTAAGIVDHATFSNVEGESAALVSRSLAPLAARVETAMMRSLLTQNGRRDYYIEHDLNALLRGDVQARANAYRVLSECGAMSANDIRARENMPPIGTAGDQFFRPANWMNLDATPSSSSTPN
jgi:HK97 family phage portal protein